MRRLLTGRAATAGIAYLWLAIVAALFAHWLAASDSPPASGEAGDGACISLGRGGAICEPAKPDVERKPETGRDDVCVSLGRGGRLCRP